METPLTNGKNVFESAQVDRYVHDRLPPDELWPELVLSPGYAVPRRFNCVEPLLDEHLGRGAGTRIAVVSDSKSWTYNELHDRVCRIANVLTRDYGIVPGNRVLLRGPNAPELVALWLAVQKCGAIAVTTMPLLRSDELSTIVDISRPALAACDVGIEEDLRRAVDQQGGRCRLLTYADETGELHERMARQPDQFDTLGTSSEDISLIGFTSGTTGRPKATIHFHRDVLAVCETVAAHIVKPVPEDIFISTAPLGFTFGLGGLVFFPLYGGAATLLNARYTPDQFLEAIQEHRASVCFTVPTMYQRMARAGSAGDATRSLRMSVSSGETLPAPVRDQWRAATGLEMTELLGATEMLHAFVGSTETDVRPGFIGRAIPGYRLAILDDDGRPLPAGTIGKLAVKGPTGCRYLEDSRQRTYVQHGWNITGDACCMDADGYVAYHTRFDDMIISSGYNISGIEIENVLLEHPQVAECAVIGTPDPERGQAVTAFVVAKVRPDDETVFTRNLQDFVRSRLAVYKYPRRVHLLPALPRNESGKIQRFRLHDTQGRTLGKL